MWLALRFPQLSIDKSIQYFDDEPLAVIVQEGAQRRVKACNQYAKDQGIYAGLSLKNAYALIPNLAVTTFNESEQQAQLEELTLWALQYSSWVSPEPPETLLLEIASSLKLFDGLDTLLATIKKDTQEMGITSCQGVAPTPAAARLLAKVSSAQPVTHHTLLQEVLATIPITYLSIDNDTIKSLRQSGIRTIGELQAISPSAIARRFGTHCSDLLYKLDGRLPETINAYQAPEVFSQCIDLPLEAPDTSALAFPLNRLLGSLGRYLTVRDLGVKHVIIKLYHHRQKPTVVDLKFLDATANTQHLFRVANERLATLCLTAPVVQLAIESCDLAPIERDNRDLFHQHLAQPNSIEQVLDTLAARLGKQAIYTAVPGNDHRPEKAWMSALLSNQQAPADWPARPVWLLTEPERLNEAVTLETLPERIENGWWDDVDVRRDYYIASTCKGAYYWVYRERMPPHQLWIHGIFS